MFMSNNFYITHFSLHSTANEITNSNYVDNNNGKEDIPESSGAWCIPFRIADYNLRQETG